MINHRAGIKVQVGNRIRVHKRQWRCGICANDSRVQKFNVHLAHILIVTSRSSHRKVKEATAIFGWGVLVLVSVERPAAAFKYHGRHSFVFEKMHSVCFPARAGRHGQVDKRIQTYLIVRACGHTVLRAILTPLTTSAIVSEILSPGSHSVSKESSNVSCW